MPSSTDNLAHYYHAGLAYIATSKKGGKDCVAIVNPETAEYRAWMAWFQRENVDLPRSFRFGESATVPCAFPDWFNSMYQTTERKPQKVVRRDDPRDNIPPEERARVRDKWKKLTATWVMRFPKDERPQPRNPLRDAAE